MIQYASIPEAQLTLNLAEVARRLHTERGYTNDTILQCESKLRKILDCRYSAIRVPITFGPDNTLDFGFGTIQSRALTRNLTGCREAFLFAVTTGIEVDRHLMRLSVTSSGEHFITDALASAFAEAACDFADAAIKGMLSCRPRFSPGYGDLPLSVQPYLLDMVDARRLLGITLSQTLFMTPKKSITAIMGIQHE